MVNNYDEVPAQPENLPIELSGSIAPKYVEEPEDTNSEHLFSHLSVNPVVRVNPTDSINHSSWTEIKQAYILGERGVSDSGAIISNDISLRQISFLYRVSYKTIRGRAKSEGWLKHRQAYLTRINDINAGMLLDYHNQEALDSEAASANALTKILVVLDTFIDSKYGDILATMDDPTKQLTSSDKEAIVGQTSVTELKELTNMLGNIYKTQRTIYDNSPTGQQAKIQLEQQKSGKFTGEGDTALTDKQRSALINSVRAKLDNLSS